MKEKSAKIFMNGRNQAVRLPRDFEFEGVDEVTIRKEDGRLIITPIRPSWTSFSDLPKASDDGFMQDRPELFDSERVKF